MLADIKKKLNGLNGHFRNKPYNCVRWACLVSLAPKREKHEGPFSMAIGNGELAHGNSKNEMRQTKTVVSMEKGKRARKKEVPTAY